MTDQWNNGSGVQDPTAPNGGTSGNNSPGDRWLRRPRRSTGDRKIAGVAGGLGRAFGIDPVLIRVAFVVLTIFGGFGGLLYVLGWLLLPADGDEVSAAEALLGRGRSSVPPPLAVGLGIVAVVAAFSMFSWGLPFLPLAIGGVILLAIMRKRRRFDQRPRWANNDWSRGPWSGQSPQDWAAQTEQWADGIRSAARAGRYGRGQWGCASKQGHGNKQSQWSGPGSSGQAGSSAPDGRSPFTEPAFWDQPTADGKAAGPAPSTPPADRVNFTKSPGATVPDPDGPSLLDEQMARTTPPAWDPLGVAPFAWDLPEPTPLPEPSASRRRGGGGVIARVAMGATLLVGGLTAAGVFAGWWALTWAQVSAIALGVLAVGLLISALRGRGYSLIGPGVFLSLVTLALAVTGISGTNGYGATNLHPAYADLQSSYASNAGEFRLDLSGVSIPKGEVKSVEVDLKGGHAEVVVPVGMTVNATCEAQVGHTECLGAVSDGLRKQSTGHAPGGTDSGTLNLDVKVNAGFAEVVTGG